MTNWNQVRFSMLVGAFVAGLASWADAEEPKRTPQEWLNRFAEEWTDRGWSGKRYMRRLDDAGWKTRMRALQGLLRHGRDAVPVLVDALKNGEAPQRILAAQTLGYLAPDVPREPLRDAAENDPHPAVRLYAVDSLGMQGVSDDAVDWQKLLKAESNRDVRKHIRYAIARKGEPVKPEIIERLKRWDAETIDSARVGKPAPDFELDSATGERIRLSQFRGKKAVVLVFIYGDT